MIFRKIGLKEVATFEYLDMEFEIQRAGLDRNMLQEQTVSEPFQKFVAAIGGKKGLDMDNLNLDQKQKVVKGVRNYHTQILGRILLVGWKGLQTGGDGQDVVDFPFDRKNAIIFTKEMAKENAPLLSDMVAFANDTANYEAGDVQDVVDFDLDAFGAEAENFTPNSLENKTES